MVRRKEKGKNNRLLPQASESSLVSKPNNDDFIIESGVKQDNISPDSSNHWTEPGRQLSVFLIEDIYVCC